MRQIGEANAIDRRVLVALQRPLPALRLAITTVELSLRRLPNDPQSDHLLLREQRACCRRGGGLRLTVNRLAAAGLTTTLSDLPDPRSRNQS
jgi:hypothetical protein